LIFLQHVVHIIDFGLAKKYQDPRTGRHIVYLEVRPARVLAVSSCILNELVLWLPYRARI
jgi:hypothetical protein